MANYNRTFELSLKDMDVIETALRSVDTNTACGTLDAKTIQGVLGKLHNQKWFYRPKNEVYVSG